MSPEHLPFLDTLGKRTLWFGAQKFQLAQEKLRPSPIDLKLWDRMEMLELTIERCE